MIIYSFNHNEKTKTRKMSEEFQNVKRWDYKQYEYFLNKVPNYMVLRQAQCIIWDYIENKRLLLDPVDQKDDFVELWQKLDDIHISLEKLYIIEKSKLIVPRNNAN